MQITTIGLDIAKNVFQVHGIDARELMLHRTRDLLMRQRTQLINALRAHMAELGIVAAQGREGIRELRRIIRANGMRACRSKLTPALWERTQYNRFFVSNLIVEFFFVQRKSRRFADCNCNEKMIYLLGHAYIPIL